MMSIPIPLLQSQMTINREEIHYLHIQLKATKNAVKYYKGRGAESEEVANTLYKAAEKVRKRIARLGQLQKALKRELQNQYAIDREIEKAVKDFREFIAKGGE